MKSIPYTPGYIYLIAIILALPATWLVVGRSGEDVPGMIAMVVTIVFFGIFTLALTTLRLQTRVASRLSRSPWSRDRDAGPKFAVYEVHGVGEYWLLDPDQLENRFFQGFRARWSWTSPCSLSKQVSQLMAASPRHADDEGS